MRKIRGCLAAVVLLAIGTALGCSGSEPTSYRVYGSVTLDGQPIPYGEVLFTPDSAKKNSGPQGIAEIHDGKYDTAAAGGKGMPGGPTVIRVNGMSGPGGKTLCEYEFRVDLPRADTPHDLNVPKKGEVKPSKDI